MRQIIGYVDVDSGSIWVGDACYLTDDRNEGTHKGAPWAVANGGWVEYSHKLSLAGHFDRGYSEVSHGNEVGHGHAFSGGKGIDIQTAWGDGSYPVYATIEEDTLPSGQIHRRITKIEIDFDPDEIEES